MHMQFILLLLLEIETAASSGATIQVGYTSDIIDNVEFSVFSDKDRVWPYTMNITASSQIELGASSEYEVLLQNAYGHELSGVLLSIESANGSIECADTCYTDATGRINTTFESYSFSKNVGRVSKYVFLTSYKRYCHCSKANSNRY